MAYESPKDYQSLQDDFRNETGKEYLQELDLYMQYYQGKSLESIAKSLHELNRKTDN